MDPDTRMRLFNDQEAVNEILTKRDGSSDLAVTKCPPARTYPSVCAGPTRKCGRTRRTPGCGGIRDVPILVREEEPAADRCRARMDSARAAPLNNLSVRRGTKQIVDAAAPAGLASENLRGRSRRKASALVRGH